MSYIGIIQAIDFLDCFLSLNKYILGFPMSFHGLIIDHFLLLLNTIPLYGYCCCCSVAKSCLTLCNPMDCSTQGSAVLQSLGVCSNSCPLSWWCYLTISSPVTLFSFCFQSFSASGSFPMSQLLSLGLPGGASGKKTRLPVQETGDAGLNPGLGRSPGEGSGNPLQYSCLENSTDRGAWQGTVHGVT